MTQPRPTRPNGARASYIALANYLILALALWLVAAPVILGFLAGAAGSNSLVIGLAVAAVALLLLRGREAAGLSAITLGAACGLFSPPSCSALSTNTRRSGVTSSAARC